MYVLSAGAQAYYTPYGLGQHYWLRDVRCSGQETSLIECDNGNLGYFTDYCYYNDVPSVVCAGEDTCKCVCVCVCM